MGNARHSMPYLPANISHARRPAVTTLSMRRRRGGRGVIGERRDLAVQLNEGIDLLSLCGDKDDVFMFGAGLVALLEHNAGDLLAVFQITDVAEELGLAEAILADFILIVLGRLDQQLSIRDGIASVAGAGEQQQGDGSRGYEGFMHDMLQKIMLSNIFVYNYSTT